MAGCANLAVDAAIERLRERKLVRIDKAAIIYSASWSDCGMREGLGGGREIAQQFFSYQVSSQEFMTVIVVLFIPEEFEHSTGTQITILSQIYQAITRAQTQLVIVADAISIQRLQTLLPNLHDFVIQEEVCMKFTHRKFKNFRQISLITIELKRFENYNETRAIIIKIF